MRPHLLQMHAKYGLHICGEGGEFETFVLDCPRFKHKRICIDQSHVVTHSDNEVSPVAFLKLDKLTLVDKKLPQQQQIDGKEMNVHEQNGTTKCDCR